MKAFVCTRYVYMAINIGDICYYEGIKKIDSMHNMVTISYNNEKYVLFESEFKQCFVSLSEHRKQKLKKLNISK